ncbi:hypothetical protein FACS1894203_4400 [Bacteroidia bacterium]|nr:hypothetical protein FACS1894203_4400 [Bacteroidia bacterium]GHU87452.1 hypothetical protein FACS1894155_00490 [Bacteroidia bacterium]
MIEKKSKQKIILIGISILLFQIGIILNGTYRNYIYENKMPDFHFADTFGNLLAVPAALFFISGIRKNTTKINCSIPAVVIAFILFELMGLIGLHGTFDVFDIAATIISGIITYLILYYIFHMKEL